MIRVLICDGDGTLELPNPSQGVRDLLDALPGLGITLAVASNNTRNAVEASFRRASLDIPSVIVTRRDIGEPKPSPRFVSEISRLTGASPTEMVFLGDDDRTDLFCAINSKVLPLRASYSQFLPKAQYGLSMSHPATVLRFLRTFGQQQPPYFGWMYTGICPDTNTTIDMRALIDNHSWDEDITHLLKGEKLTDDRKRAGIFIALGLGMISSCFQSSLIQNIDWITFYPGHLKGSQNNLLSAYSRQLSRLFSDTFKDDLLVRYKDAPQSRRQGADRRIFPQFDSIHVNPKYAHLIKDKRILVLDDFTTRGFSLEAARRMLLKAGCRSVVGVTCGKFGTDFAASRLAGNWDAYRPFTLSEAAITTVARRGQADNSVDRFFRDVVWPEYVN